MIQVLLGGLERDRNLDIDIEDAELALHWERLFQRLGVDQFPGHGLGVDLAAGGCFVSYGHRPAVDDGGSGQGHSAWHPVVGIVVPALDVLTCTDEDRTPVLRCPGPGLDRLLPARHKTGVRLRQTDCLQSRPVNRSTL